MKIYFAGPEIFDLGNITLVLFSYYDISLSQLPFRKKTWNLLIIE